MAPTLLAEATISEGLEALDGWEREGDRIKRELIFDDFLSAIAFINRVAPLAEAADHHPELFNVYNRVELVLTTHDAGGLTAKDFDLAAAIDRVVQPS
ncbi:4a-hydroxytetrahydrobiopterin dehydratase [Lujinxingia litoralis]|uniref:Putative pterin-4-alpha-carbinolamine dehydratase n=1 Tax=Lujinxingia litoralis TaxID=2211119 RepID=A0A328CDF0_9DELT|nr:4a-hydroxytetrahydrobiopterin dehydratase [Lujinxingia litoralis]RAL24673.1 4a-hydroxytetrahydrobiopterin dehydratase [Lujinxingia litoralis]